MRHLTHCLAFLLMTLCLSDSYGQSSRRDYIADTDRFSMGIIAGMTNSQIDGDLAVGFDNPQFTFGLRGITRITPRLEANMEFLLAKKGSQFSSFRELANPNPKKDNIIDLTYVDVPFFVKWKLTPNPNSWHLESGVIYSRLLNTTVTETIINPELSFSFEDAVSSFSNNDVSLLSGFGYTWAGGIALEMRYVFGLKKFYKNPIPFDEPFHSRDESNRVQFLRNYYFQISMSYTIFKRKTINGKRRR